MVCLLQDKDKKSISKEVSIMKNNSIKKIMMALAIVFVSVLGMKASANATSITDLQRKFPNGAYWNHVVRSGHRYSNYNDVGGCNNPDGYTWTPCNTHNGNVGVGGHDCNTFGSGMQCNGFARKLSYDLYGSMHPSWGRGNISTAKRGDVIHYYGAGADYTYGHWAMIIGKSGSVITLGECNAGGNCKIVWGRTIDTNRMSSYVIYSAPWEATYDSDSQKPNIGDVRITDVNKDGYTITCTVSDNVGVTSVKFPSWCTDIHGGNDAVWLQGSVNGNTASCRVNLSSLKSGARQGNYMTHIYAYDAAGNQQCVPFRSTPLFIDRTDPELKDVKISDVDNTGYTVTCTATDNVGINRVQFPTWTSENGQDDLASDWINNVAVRGTKDGDTYTFRVNDSAHNYERGNYITHVYAYDAAGNAVCVAAEAVEIKNNSIGEKAMIYNGHTYVRYDDILTWEEARDFCKKRLGNLVTINSQAEQKVIEEFIQDGKRDAYNIGINDVENEGTFVWVNGEKVTYTNWEATEPNNYGGNEDYGQIKRVNGKWNDNSLGNLCYGFILEIPFDVEKVGKGVLGGVSDVISKLLGENEDNSEEEEEFSDITEQPDNNLTEEEPADTPTASPTATPTKEPVETPTASPTATPTDEPTESPVEITEEVPTATPTEVPTMTATPEEEDLSEEFDVEDTFVPVRQIKFKGRFGTYFTKKYIQLKVSVNADATDKSISWSSSNKKYVKVNAKGKLTVKKAGIGKTVRITAKAKDGCGAKTVVKVKVVKRAGKIYLVRIRK